jgi:MFS family permease
VLVVVALPPRSRGAHSGPRLDVVGAVLVTAGLTALVLGVMNAGEPGPAGPAVVVEALGGIGLLAAFGLHQQRWAAHPLIPPSIFRIRAVSSANAVMFLVGLGFFASPVLLSLALQNNHGYPPVAAGLAFVPGAVGLVVGGRFAGRMAVALGTRRAAVAGLLTAAAGFAGLAVVLGLPALLPAAMAGSAAVFGLGVGTAFTPITIAATGGVSPDRYGTAAGLLNTVRQASGAIGLAALSAVAVGRGAPGASGSGYVLAFALAAACTLLAAAVAAVAMPRRRSSPEPGRSRGANPVGSPGR